MGLEVRISLALSGCENGSLSGDERVSSCANACAVGEGRGGKRIALGLVIFSTVPVSVEAAASFDIPNPSSDSLQYPWLLPALLSPRLALTVTACIPGCPVPQSDAAEAFCSQAEPLGYQYSYVPLLLAHQ